MTTVEPRSLAGEVGPRRDPAQARELRAQLLDTSTRSAPPAPSPPGSIPLAVPPATKPARSSSRSGQVAKEPSSPKPSRKRAPKEYQPSRLALRGVDGYLTRGRGEITAWFVEPPVAWSMRSQDVREKRLTARALRIAELVERGVAGAHQRVVHRPWPVAQWARDFDEWASRGATPPPGDVPGALSWGEFVVGEQHAQLRRPSTSKSVYWGIPLSKRSVLAQFLESVTGATSWAGPVQRVLSRHMDSVLDRELADLSEELRDLSSVMGSFGVQARPASASQMQWLLWRSATLGLPAPRLDESPSGQWDLADLAALVDAADVVAEPLRDCVQVSGVVGGERFTRFVAVLTLGRMGDLAIPEQALPWQVWGDGLGPIDQSVRLRFPAPEAVRRTLDRQISRILNQERHITVEHDLPCPPDLAEKVERASLIKNEIQTDHTKLTTRVEGWWRFAVSALSVEEVLQRADAMRQRYSPAIALESGEGQYQQYREFMPHEPLSSTAYRRRMSVRLAAAGLASVSDRIGDRHGPHIAETASLSRRPVNWDMWFAQEKLDKSGLTPVVGGLGSGKAVELPTRIPTPVGWTTMGDLNVGDQVLGRDGRPCSVTFLSDINDQPDLYEVTFSDGQTVRADFEHQWVVSTHRDRNYRRDPKRRSAIARWDDSRVTVRHLLDLAARFDDEHESSIDELFALLKADPELITPWKATSGLYAALTFVECPSRLGPRQVTRRPGMCPERRKRAVEIFRAVPFLQANIKHWRSPQGSNASLWGVAAVKRSQSASEVLARLDEDVEATATEIARWIAEAGGPQPSTGLLRAAARRAGVSSRSSHAEVPVATRSASTATRFVLLYPTAAALKALAVRIQQQFGDRPSAQVSERRVTTGEMLAEGLTCAAGSQFAVRVPEPLDRAPYELPVDPYVLGAWLGDGNTGQGIFTQGDTDVCTDRHGLTDRDFLVLQLKSSDVDAYVSGQNRIHTRGLAKLLSAAGVLDGKHLPALYLRSAARQRLALLQGLMDTDGSIKPGGHCELVLCDERLARDALELIRSLGIKASMRAGASTITGSDPDRVGEKRRRVTGARWRIQFTTATAVFRLPRKLARVPLAVSERSKWLYVVSIEPVLPAPARCITVNSPDHTYLIEGFIPTSNTHLCGMLVYKGVRAGAHGIVLDPSGPLRKLAELPELAPYTRLIDLMEAPPGTLNPYRVIVDPPREDYPQTRAGQAQYESDVRAVAAERKTFVADVLRMLLPWDMQQSPHVRRAMDKAVDAVGGSSGCEPGLVITALQAVAGDQDTGADTREAAEDTARKLNELRPHRQVRLLFPQSDIDGWAALDDARLTILTMPGVQLPKLGTDPGTWSLPQRLGVPLLHLASWLTHRLIYEAPRKVRKIVFLDEGKYLSGSGAGQMLYARLERDTRKYNVRALIASQLPDDFLALPGFEALTHEIIIGSLEGAKVQAAALELLRLGAGAGWEALLEGLNSQGGLVELTHDPDVLATTAEAERAPREYVMRIGDDVEIIRVDYSTSPHLAHVVEALDSRPTAESGPATGAPG